MLYNNVQVMPGSDMHKALTAKDSDKAKAKLIWDEMLQREKAMLDSATRHEKKDWADRWARTDEELEAVRSKWHALSFEQPKAESREYPIWDAAMKKEVRGPSVHLHNQRIKLLLDRK